MLRGRLVKMKIRQRLRFFLFLFFWSVMDQVCRGRDILPAEFASMARAYRYKVRVSATVKMREVCTD